MNTSVADGAGFTAVASALLLLSSKLLLQGVPACAAANASAAAKSPLPAASAAWR